MTTVGLITSSVVNQNVGQGQMVRKDTETLDRSVVNLKTIDVGVLHLVGIEELGLLLAVIASLAIPPTGTITLDLTTRGLVDSNGVAGNRDQRTNPLLVTKGGGTGKGNNSALVESSKIKSFTSGNSNILQNDGGTRLLASNSRLSILESTTSTGVEIAISGSGSYHGSHGQNCSGGKKHNVSKR